MTPKERILTALKCGIPDRVPVSTYELDNTLYPDSWERQQPSYVKLMDFVAEKCDLFLPCGISWNDPNIQKIEVVNTRKEGIHTFIDMIWKTPKGDLVQKKRVDDGINTTWTLEHLVKTDEDMEKILSVPFSAANISCSHLKELEKKVGDRGVLFVGFGDPICAAADIIEFGEFTVKVFTDFDRVKKLMDKLHEVYVHILREALKTLKGMNAVIRLVGPEYATPPYLPPEMFHKLVCEYDKTYIRMIKEAGLMTRVHSHGKVAKVLDHFLEMGAEALDPIEPPTQGDITLAEAKKRCKGRICLCGGVELVELENGTPESVEKLVKNCMDQAKKGGGYMIVPTACPINVPLSPKTEQNYYTMIESAIKYGKY
jgi:uroporphyrinogen-III decarboxylase